MKRCKVSSAASWEPAHVNLENVEEFLHFLIERPAKTQRRRVSLCSGVPCYERHDTNNYLSVSLQSAIVQPGISPFAEPTNSFWGFLEKLESHLPLSQAALLKCLPVGPTMAILCANVCKNLKLELLAVHLKVQLFRSGIILKYVQ